MILKKEMFALSAQDIFNFKGQLWLEGMPSFLHKYNTALRGIGAVLEAIDEEFKIKNEHNPIHHIESRIKTIKSLSAKLEKKGLPLDLDVAKANITDIAGIRVICNYVDDIYDMVATLKGYFAGQVIKVCDYISNPKPNGYRSYHIVIKFPIFAGGKMEEIPVEIQLRTIAMEMWASLEHELRYKSTLSDDKDLVAKEKLRICSLTMKLVDESMQDIYKEIKGANL